MPRQVVSIVRGVNFRNRGLQLGKDLFDRIEVGRVAGQEEQLGAGGADQAAYGLTLVAAKIIHDDNIARAQGGGQELLDPRLRGQAAARKLAPLIGPSTTQGAVMRSWRSAARNSLPRRRPRSACASGFAVPWRLGERRDCSAQPAGHVGLGAEHAPAKAGVSSMNTRRLGSSRP
jgi:hypothetical protein